MISIWKKKIWSPWCLACLDGMFYWWHFTLWVPPLMLSLPLIHHCTHAWDGGGAGSVSKWAALRQEWSYLLDQKTRTSIYKVGQLSVPCCPVAFHWKSHQGLYSTMLLCKTKWQYLLICKGSRYCLLALHSRMSRWAVVQRLLLCSAPHCMGL